MGYYIIHIEEIIYPSIEVDTPHPDIILDRSPQRNGRRRRKAPWYELVSTKRQNKPWKTKAEFTRKLISIEEFIFLFARTSDNSRKVYPKILRSSEDISAGKFY
mgnify:CR=1 FL=1